MMIVWLVLLLVFLVVEAATVSLTSVWFALGALGALISAAVAPEIIWLQIVWFLLISGVTLYFTRPLAKKHLNAKKKATNADRMLELTGLIQEPVDNLMGKGTVLIDGKLWTARSASGEKLATGALVRPIRIEGVKLIVEPEETVANSMSHSSNEEHIEKEE